MDRNRNNKSTYTYTFTEDKVNIRNIYKCFVAGHLTYFISPGFEHAFYGKQS